jgi:hypothetical protein
MPAERRAAWDSKSAADAARSLAMMDSITR